MLIEIRLMDSFFKLFKPDFLSATSALSHFEKAKIPSPQRMGKFRYIFYNFILQPVLASRVIGTITASFALVAGLQDTSGDKKPAFWAGFK